MRRQADPQLRQRTPRGRWIYRWYVTVTERARPIVAWSASAAGARAKAFARNLTPIAVTASRESDAPAANVIVIDALAELNDDDPGDFAGRRQHFRRRRA